MTKSKIRIVEECISPDTFDDRDLPSDVHIITYKIGDEVQFDAVRAYTKVDIFDEYYDKLRGTGEIISIESGYGRIKPLLYGKIDSGSWYAKLLMLPLCLLILSCTNLGNLDVPQRTYMVAGIHVDCSTIPKNEYDEERIEENHYPVDLYEAREIDTQAAPWTDLA